MRKERSTVNGQWSIVLILLCCCFFTISASSQKVSTLISKDKIVIGEQLYLKIKVEGISEGLLKQDFQFPDTVNHIEILADSIDKVDASTTIHTLTLTSFDSGYWQLPAFKILLADQRILSSTPLNITVLPVNVSDMQDYHDIKDILEIDTENNWWIIFSIVALALLSLFAVLWFMNSRKNTVEQKPITATSLQLLFNDFIKRLEELQSTELANQSAIVYLFTQTSELTRSFVDKAYHQNTSHLTSGEYMLTQKNKMPDVQLENQYFQFLRLADAVKFAKYFPPAQETESIFPLLRNVATSVYQQMKPLS
jgi:hypothetical protein